MLERCQVHVPGRVLLVWVLVDVVSCVWSCKLVIVLLVGYLMFCAMCL